MAAQTVTRKTVKMATLDTAFRKCIHEAYDYTCAYPQCPNCNNESLRYGDVSIECAHFHNRRASAGRWFPDNVACLCHEIHAYLEVHNAEESEFFYDNMGMEKYDALKIRMQGLYRYKPWERSEMAAHYRAQMRSIEKRRLNGEKGFIEVVSWD